MADCGLPRPLLDAWLAGGGSPEDAARVEAHLPTCEACRVLTDQASLGVGLLLIADGGRGGGGAEPSPGFTDRVMASVRAEGPRAGVDDDGPPATAKPLPAPAGGRPRAGVDDDAPPPQQRPLPPRGRLLGLPRPAWAGAAAALAAGAAWMVLLRDPGTTVVPPGPGTNTSTNTPEKGRGSVAARDGGVLRWTGPFDGSLAGSVWVAKDGAVPTYAGELLHSPAPSSFLALLPEGGRLDAGPSSWLAVGGPGEAALLEGGFTATADGGRPLELETPAGRVTVPAGGEVEISVGAAAGGPGTTWLGLWAAARRDGVDPGRPIPPPPSTAQVIFARRGAVEFAAGGGPVRNTLERTSLKEGQALVILESKAFLATGVDDDGPPDSSRWMDGLPVPPGSRFFRRPVKGTPKPETPPGGFGTASGPVRNTLERSLGGGSTPSERAYALSVYESVGGVEAVAAAAKAADDPAVEVRCAALRVLALTASADRETALAALRKLARDEDAFVARFAILALKTLRDEGAVEVLRAIAVDDDAPPDSPKRGVDDDAPPGRIVAKVYALDALVALGDRSLLKEGAALLPEAEKDPVLYPVLRQFVYDAMDKLPREELRAYYADPRPGVKAAALLALQDFDLAEEALKSESEIVKLAGALVLLGGKHPSALEKVGAVEWKRPESRAALVLASEPVLTKNPTLEVPAWVDHFARGVLTAVPSTTEAVIPAVQILDRQGDWAGTEFHLSNGTSETIAKALMAHLTGVPVRLLRELLASDDEEVRYAAMFSSIFWLSNHPTHPDTQTLIDLVCHFRPTSDREATLVATFLANAAKSSKSTSALEALLDMTRSTSTDERQAAATMLGFVNDPDVECHRLIELLSDQESRVNSRAALTIVLLVNSNKWAGPPAAGLYPSPSPNPLVRALLAIPAMKAGDTSAEVAFLDDLRECTVQQRLVALLTLHRTATKLSKVDPDLLRDPDPAIRIRTLLSTTMTPSDIALTRELTSDPNLWVRAVALAQHVALGVESARSQLGDILNRLGSFPGLASQMAQGVDVSQDSVVMAVSLFAMMSIDEGSIADGNASEMEQSMYAQAVLMNRGRALNAAHRIQGSSSSEVLETVLRELAEHSSTESLALLAMHLPVGESRLASPDSSEGIAVSSYSKSIGFTPFRANQQYHKVRHLGFFSGSEVMARSR